ncbi:Hypothetical predicted protein [Mytilus galloprovincialis]|uniref:Uncharacterized protein n=1 Tax=Mytilus galloprovincialis TaxID=29158 RepID=A0A8B6F1V2_MYTGA|nr:Hypothetical predicted protein [Mytilus galloprovincialis]
MLFAVMLKRFPICTKNRRTCGGQTSIKCIFDEELAKATGGSPWRWLYRTAESQRDDAKSDIDISFIAQLDGDYQAKSDIDISFIAQLDGDYQAKSDIDISFIAQLDGDYQAKSDIDISFIAQLDGDYQAKSDIDISFIAQLDGDYQGKLFCSVHKPKYNILRKKKSKSSEYKCMYQNINSSFSPFDHYSSSVTGQHAEQFLSQTALNVNGRYKSIISLNPNAYKPFQKLTGSSGIRTRDLSHPKRESYP